MRHLKYKPVPGTPDEISYQVIRASGQAICFVCKDEYWKHPLVSNCRGFNGDMYLNVLCNGDIVKL